MVLIRLCYLTMTYWQRRTAYIDFADPKQDSAVSL